MSLVQEDILPWALIANNSEVVAIQGAINIFSVYFIIYICKYSSSF